jgi:hypothetical protein
MYGFALLFFYDEHKQKLNSKLRGTNRWICFLEGIARMGQWIVRYANFIDRIFKMIKNKKYR